MSDSINWMGNKVFDPNVSRQTYKNNAVSAPVQQNGTACQSKITAILS
jgi:hypothetical protein